MKRGLKVLFGLACAFMIGLPMFAQPNSKSIETFVMDDFDSAGAQNYVYNGEKLSWDWGVNSSRFVAEGYPKTGYYDGIPNSLKVFKKGSDIDPKVFGVKTAFNRKGDNWFEVYPMKDGKPYEIPFIGDVTQVDFWVWGANYKYFLELMVRDALGRVHVLQCGSLAFNGWRNIIINIPGWLQQHSHLRSGPENMTFVGFRIRSDAEEYVDNYVIFFDQIKYTSNSLSYIYDGYELKDVDFGDSGDGK
ncbi:MAG: flagellar filament outer layer protein FlaA [Treponema sp.]|nr:flagellar filament outer layer protein FlaA [Treponema sp.]